MPSGKPPVALDATFGHTRTSVSHRAATALETPCTGHSPAVSPPVPVAWLALGLMAAPVAADDAVQMTARALFDGHARVGSWVAISVDLANDGPPIVGELALAAGTSGKTRYAVPVDLPSPVGQDVCHPRPGTIVRRAS